MSQIIEIKTVAKEAHRVGLLIRHVGVSNTQVREETFYKCFIGISIDFTSSFN